MSDRWKEDAAKQMLKDEEEIIRLRNLLSDTNTYYSECIADREDLRTALIDTLAALTAAVSLLERGGKKAAPSDKMFAQMLVDYNNCIERGRAVATSKGLVDDRHR